MIDKSYVGKYVCFDRADGGACWGRIKDVGLINTRDGEKEVFILENRYVRYWRTHDLKNFRTFFPGASAGDLSMSMPGKMANGSFASANGCEKNELFLEVSKVRGDSTLHLDQIDLENDIVDLSDVLDLVDDDKLFKAILGAKGEAVNGKNALEIGVMSLLSGDNIDEATIVELKRRLGMKI